MSHLSPVRLFHLMNALTSWHLDAYDGMSDEEMTQQVLEETAGRPAARRRLINDLSDLLFDEGIELETRDEFVAEGAFRNVGEPGQMAEWLQRQLSVVIADRPTERTVSADGVPPTLLEIYGLLSRLNKLRSEVGELPSPDQAARQVVGSQGELADELPKQLLCFVNSTYPEREKADFVVDCAGPHFYSDLEAIEWAAEVARAIQRRTRVV